MSIKKVLSDTAVITASSVVFLIVLGIIIQTIVGGAAYLLGTTDSVFELFTISLALILLAWVVCITGLLSSGSDVQKGGAVIAKRLGAVQASVRTNQNNEKTLIKTIKELAASFGCAVPSVHVLKDDTSINSMVVGSFNGDVAMVFTKGAIQNLEEEEISALVAHEFAHIVNNDVTRNMKLMVAFGGLLALRQYGRFLIEKEFPSAFYAPLKLIGYPMVVLGFVGIPFAYVLRAVYTRGTEVAADRTAVTMLKSPRALRSAFARIKKSPGYGSALNASYAEEVRHLYFHASSDTFWRTRFNSIHPSIDVRLKKINLRTIAAYARDGSSLNETSTRESGADTSATKETRSTQVSYSARSGASASSPKISKAAEDAARTLNIMGDATTSTAASDKLAMSVQDPVSSLAALFSLFMPIDIDPRARYLSAVAFAYNQNFADTVEHLNEIMSREIHVERLSVAKHATAQLKTKLAPDASRRVLLNIERLLKSQGLHSLMNYSAVQYLRHELAADFPVLNTRADENEPNAEGGHLVPADKMGEEFSRLISLVFDATDLDREVIDIEYDRVMAFYPNADYPRCVEEELDDVPETEAAFQLLLMQPRAIRETFVQHCKDIFDLDKEDVQPKRSQLALLCAALGCSSLYGERLGDEGYLRKVA